ncbi:AIPR family protein [Nocardia gipuzkoensis]
MGLLHLGQIKQTLENVYLPHIDLEGAEQEHHQLSRAVAALAMAGRSGLSVETVAKSVTDHVHDGGIDGVVYAADRSTMIFVQSKWTDTTNGLSLGDVLKFIRGVEKVLRNEWSPFGGPIVSRRAEIEDILFQPGTKIELVLATTTTASLSQPQVDALEQFCNDMNDASEIAGYTYMNQGRLHQSVASEAGSQIDLAVNLRNWGSYSEAGCVAYYGTVSAQEVVTWYQAHGDLLFSRNIRGALTGSEVNDSIVATAGSDPSRFWFFNNGITAIAESFAQAPYVNQKSGNFTFTRASVVNGAQTVSSLARAARDNPELNESADVFVRFVTVDDPDGEFARLVTRRTNTQNRVGGREFVSLDPEQERIRMEFGVSGLRYAYRSGEVVTDPSKGCDLTDATVALACAIGIDEAVLAKRELSKLWEDTTKAPYKALFNPSVTAIHVWTAVEVMRRVDQVLEFMKPNMSTRDRALVVHGNRFVLWAVMHQLDIKNIKAGSEFSLPFDEAQIASITQLTIENTIELVSEHFADSYPQPLFKNQTKCRTLGDLIMRALEQA